MFFLCLCKTFFDLLIDPFAERDVILAVARIVGEVFDFGKESQYAFAADFTFKQIERAKILHAVMEDEKARGKRGIAVFVHRIDNEGVAPLEGPCIAEGVNDRAGMAGEIKIEAPLQKAVCFRFVKL